MMIMPNGTGRGWLARLHQWGVCRPFRYYTVPLLAWIVAISVASLAPSRDLPQLDFKFADKVGHLAVYVIFGALLLRGWTRQQRPRWAVFLTLALVTYLWGLYLEFLQRLTGDRSFDLWDAACNGLGALIGMGLWTAAVWRGTAEEEGEGQGSRV